MDGQTVDQLATDHPYSSWAIWTEQFPDEGCVEETPERLIEFIESNVDQLVGSVVLLSLEPSDEKPAGYRNFHSPSGRNNDDRLKHFIQDEELTNITGGFMTDIFPSPGEFESSDVRPIESDIDRFTDQLRTIGFDEYQVICFSNRAFQLLWKMVGGPETELPHSIESFTGLVHDIEVSAYRVWHYSNWGTHADKIHELKQQLRYLNNEIVG
jgi:hypothetical protein